MTNTSELSMFGDICDVNMSVMQMENIASDLVFLLRHNGLSRSELASSLGWKKSRITRVLSGNENLTIKTITSVAECLGYGFDVVFYNENYDQPKQPWHIDKLNKAILSKHTYSEPPVEVKVQDGKAVFNDLIEGNDADFYISISKNFDINKIKSIQATENVLSNKGTFHWDVNSSSSNSFISSLKDKEQWTTA